MAGSGSDVTDLAAVEGYAVAGCLMPKDGVNGPQHRLGRAKRDLERHHAPFLPGRADAAFEMLSHPQKGSRVGALKAVDRLFGVADRKDRAHAVAGPFSGVKLFGERRHNFPLLRVGVLRFVDQNVVETAIELEQHPGRDAWLAQQTERT